MYYTSPTIEGHSVYTECRRRAVSLVFTQFSLTSAKTGAGVFFARHCTSPHQSSAILSKNCFSVPAKTSGKASTSLNTT